MGRTPLKKEEGEVHRFTGRFPIEIWNVLRQHNFETGETIISYLIRLIKQDKNLE